MLSLGATFQQHLRKNSMAIKVFSETEEKETVNKAQLRDIEKFVCEVYVKKQLDSVNDALLQNVLEEI